MNTLKAKEGMFLTQIEETGNRIFFSEIIGVKATYEYWRDATLQEKEEYEKKERENLPNS